MKRTIQCVHKMNISGCAECYPVFLAETDQTPPNTTPLNEEDRLGEILKPLSDNGYHNNSEDSTRSTCYDCKRIETAKQELTNLIQTLEQKAYENGLHDGEQVATFVFIKRLQARKKNTAPNSGAGREIKDLLKELEK